MEELGRERERERVKFILEDRGAMHECKKERFAQKAAINIK